MQESLLTEEEIQFVNYKARFSLVNMSECIQAETKFKTDISIISRKKLIFIHGDFSTGLMHINMRHNFYTNASTFIFNPSNKFLRTSKFSQSTNNFDYPKITDSLFETCFLDLKGNKKPDLFDTYTAPFMNENYRLILYKNTKIVHTLFPIKSKSKGNPLEKFERKDILTHCNHDTAILVVVVPYYDANRILRYGIEVIISMLTHEEDWNILIFENEQVCKQVELGKQTPKYGFGGFGARLHQINYADLSSFESLIDKIDKGKIT